METPSSVRRITRSQTKPSIISIPMSRKNEESERVLSRQKNAKPDRSALIDITNDSPIVGLAMGSLETPSSFVKKWDQSKKTPGSGEALLRYQAKSLLQKVEEEAELSKLTLENRPFVQVQGFVNSPSGLLAPTPANTPQVLNLSVNEDMMSINVDGFVSETLLEVEEESKALKMVIDESTEATLESHKSLITRLIFDFSDKSEISDSSSSICSSVLTDQERSSCEEKSTEEDDASVWSIQVNASTKDEDEDGEIAEEDYEEEDYEEEEEEDYEDAEEGGLLDELCEGLSKITVEEKKLPEFEGKHTRFIYNSDDEIEGEEEISSAVSPSIIRLKGVPTPEGKHLRFPDEEED